MCTANSFISVPLAIVSLIVDRTRVLDLSRPDLVRRAGYKNIAKGLRRLDELLAGDFDKTRNLVRALPAALDVATQVVEHASRRHVAELLKPRRSHDRRGKQLGAARLGRTPLYSRSEQSLSRSLWPPSSASSGCWASTSILPCRP